MQTNRLTVIICSVVFSVISLTSLHAQQRWSVGPRLGATISKITGDPKANTFLPGFTGGFYVMYSDINHFGISGDVLFSQRGGKYDFIELNNIRYTYTQRINYIEIPIMARYFLNLEGALRPNVFAGGAAGFRLNAKQKNIQENDTRFDDFDNTDLYKPVDLSFLVGVGLNFKIAKARWIQTDIRYQQSLVTTFNGSPQAGTSTPNYRNSSFSVLFSYALGVGKKYKK